MRRHLISGASLTPLQALRQYGCFRLAAIIHILRHEEFFNIKTTIRSVDGKNFAEYKLERKPNTINI